MPTIGSETYRSTNVTPDVTKETYSSRAPVDNVPGPDYPSIEITKLTPASMAVTSEDGPVVVEGTGFTEGHVIVWNGGDEPTTFVDAEHLSTIVKPSTVSVEPPFTLPVLVRLGEFKSNSLEFTFTAGRKHAEHEKHERHDSHGRHDKHAR